MAIVSITRYKEQSFVPGIFLKLKDGFTKRKICLIQLIIEKVDYGLIFFLPDCRDRHGGDVPEAGVLSSRPSQPVNMHKAVGIQGYYPPGAVCTADADGGRIGRDVNRLAVPSAHLPRRDGKGKLHIHLLTAAAKQGYPPHHAVFVRLDRYKTA